MLHMTARSQYSLTLYLVNGEVSDQSATVVYSCTARW
jgi:hypothetical protein